MNADPYRELRRVLADAHDQAATGKGRARHAGDGAEPLAFEAQPILALARMQEGQRAGSGLAGLVFQAGKKVNEALGRPPAEARRELLGAMVYAAAAALLTEELEANGGGGD